MTESVYDGAQTAGDILIGYRHYLRDEMVNLTDSEIEDLIKKLKECADNSHGPRRHEEINGSIVIKEKTQEKKHPFLSLPCWSKSSLVSMLDDLEDRLEDFTDERLTSLQYELDMFREDFDDFLTPEQVEWFDRMYDIVSHELDARWMLKKLEERHIVRIERS